MVMHLLTMESAGVLVRMSDKIKRFMSVSEKGISLVNNESLRDTLIDLHNYSAMAIMLMDEKLKDGEIVEESGPFPRMKSGVEIAMEGAEILENNRPKIWTINN